MIPTRYITIYADTHYSYDCPACKIESILVNGIQKGDCFRCRSCNHEMWVDKIDNSDNNWNVVWSLARDGKLLLLSIRIFIRALKNVFNMK